ncbi:MAG: hypothetical protein FJ297_02065 [Planctomycetes bacterium]|nr:hypothetical protein [Planctomycetota bacterium]
MERRRLLALLALLVSGPAGCNQNPFAPGPQGAFWRQPQQTPEHVAQLQDLDSRNRKLDTNNSDLHRQLAQSEQQRQLVFDENQLLRKQLTETTNQLETKQRAVQDAERRIEAMVASTRQRGGATITANNSLTRNLTAVTIPGLDVRRDGDVVRVEIPADQLFETGTVRWQANAPSILDSVAAAIAQSFPKQKVAVEGHTDNASLREASTFHQLAASQSLAVIQHFVQRAALPERQWFSVAHGPNEPLVSNGTPAGRARNRRIEIVIYPESF